MKKGERRKEKESNSRLKRAGGFTLLELVIVVSVILILGIGVFLILDPVQMAARSRDASRVADLEAITGAIDFAATEQVVSTDNWEPNEWNTTDGCVGENDQRIFVSVPLDNGESDPTDLPSGWTYKRVIEANFQNVNGSGWLPVDLTNSASVASPISHLPADAINTFASGFYLSYVCSRSPNDYEITARMASELYRTGGPSDAQSDDGGDDIFAYEVGSNIGLNPKAPIAYWSFGGDVSGAISDNDTVGLEDASGNGNNGRADNNNAAGMSWVAGVIGGAVDFDGIDDYVQVTSPILSGGSDMSIAFWMKIAAAQSSSWKRQFSDASGGAEIYFTADGTTGLYGALGDSTTGWIMSNPDLTGGVWRQITIVTPSSGAPARVDSYLNGSFYTSGSQASTFSTVTLDDLYIGTSQSLNPNYFLDGILDEIAIYNRILTVEEIAYQYNALKP